MAAFSRRPAAVEAARAFLLETASRSEKSLVTYGELALSWGGSPMSVGPVLNSVQRECEMRGEPNLTVLAVNARHRLPTTFHGQRVEPGDPSEEEWRAEVDRVRQFSWSDQKQEEPRPASMRGGRLAWRQGLSGRSGFIDLARMVHRGRPSPAKVYLTDRYILTRKGEDGEPSRIWSRLAEYLDAVRVRQDFDLVIWNGYVQSAVANKGLMREWETGLRRIYPAATITWPHSGMPKFHDRFYLTSGRSTADLAGVFGPSLNGVDSSALYLVGELTPDTVQALRRHLDEARPGRPTSPRRRNR